MRSTIITFITPSTRLNICAFFSLTTKLQKLKSIALSILIMLLLGGCALNTKIKSDFGADTDSSDFSINASKDPHYKIAIVAASKDYEFAECVEKGLRSRLKNSNIISEEQFRDEIAPWTNICERPSNEAELYQVLSNPLIHNKLDEIGLDFIVYVGGSTKWHESGWVGAGEFLVAGYVQKERKTYIRTTVVDIKKSKLLGNALVRSKGVIAIPIFGVFVPIPLGLATETSACRQTSQHIANSLVRTTFYAQKVEEDGLEDATTEKNVVGAGDITARRVVNYKSEVIDKLRRSAIKDNADSQYNLGLIYYEGDIVSQDYQETIKWWLKAATQGHVGAQYGLGTMYLEGKGINNQREALVWLKKAADQGHSLANQRLELIVNEDQHIVQDDIGNFEKYMQAAEQGDAFAQHEIASRYHKGFGVSQDYEQALKWFKRASENGYVDSTFEVSEMYYWGEGLPRDKREAGQWCLKAANLGHGKAECAMGLRYSEIVGSQSYWGSKIDEYKWLRVCIQNKEIPPSERNKAYYQLTRLKSGFSEGTLEYAETVASELRTKTLEPSQQVEVKTDEAGTLNRLGLQKYWQAYTKTGQAKEDTYREATDLLTKSAEMGNKFAQERLSQMYYEGKGVPRDFEKASMWLEKSAVDASAYDQYELGQKFRKGKEFPKILSEAYKWYKRAAERGHPGAQYRLGRIYRDTNEYLDLEQAFHWFKLAAENNYSRAQYYLAKIYHYGMYGVGNYTDHEKAWKWYTVAIKNGNREAEEWFKILCQESAATCEKMSFKASVQEQVKGDSYIESAASCTEIAGNYEASVTDNCGGRKVTSDIDVKVTGDCSFVAMAYDNGLITKGTITAQSGNNYGGNATNKSGCGTMELNCTINVSGFTCNYNYTNGAQGTIISKAKL